MSYFCGKYNKNSLSLAKTIVGTALAFVKINEGESVIVVSLTGCGAQMKFHGR